MKELGGREEQFGNLEERLKSNEEVIRGMHAIVALAKESEPHNVAFMCSEGNWRECHRQFLAAHLVENGMASVQHILRDAALEAHPPGHRGVIAKHEKAKAALAKEAETILESREATPPPVVSTAPVSKEAKPKKRRLQ